MLQIEHGYWMYGSKHIELTSWAKNQSHRRLGSDDYVQNGFCVFFQVVRRCNSH